MSKIKFFKGQRIYFAEEKKPYTVIAHNERYAVCTKPYNLKKTKFYTIIDLKAEIRGPENLVFGMGANDFKECDEMLTRITTGETEISHRHRITLRIKKYDNARFKKYSIS